MARSVNDPTTIVGRVRDFFRQNPHEILTLADARTKFDISEKQLARCLETLRHQGFVDTAVCIMRAAPEVVA